MSIRIFFLFCCLSIFIPVAFCQHSVLSSTLSSSSRAMARAGLCSSDPESGLVNPALLGLISKNGISLHGHNYYLLQGVSSFSLEGHLSLKSNHGFGLIVAHDGSVNYNENLIGIQYGRKLTKSSLIGIQFNYLNRNVAESKAVSSIGFDIGFQTKLTKNIYLGAVAKNPIPIVNKAIHAFPSMYKLGLMLILNEKFQILCEAHKTIHQPIQIIGGLQYRPSQIITLRTGFDVGTTTWAFGISWNSLRFIQFDLSSEYNIQLGFSPSAALRFPFK